MVSTKSIDLKVESSEALYKLFLVIDDLGLVHRYSAEDGELEVSIHGEWLMFYVDRRVLDDEREIDRAYEDAQRIAEAYWRE
jgi:hypothetical protein